MKIPLRLQVFGHPTVVIPDKDVQRLTPHLVSSGHLNEVFLIGINVEDLKRLVILELKGKQRPDILTRLLGRISKTQSRQVKARIASCLNRK